MVLLLLLLAMVLLLLLAVLAVLLLFVLLLLLFGVDAFRSLLVTSALGVVDTSSLLALEASCSEEPEE